MGFLNTKILDGYFVSDGVEAAAGAFFPMLFFFSLRQSGGALFDPLLGIFVSVLMLIWIVKLTKPINNVHLALDALIVLAISVTLTLQFGLATADQLRSIDFFGSTAIVGFWLGIGSALAFDAFNVKSIIAGKFVNKRL